MENKKVLDKNLYFSVLANNGFKNVYCYENKDSLVEVHLISDYIFKKKVCLLDIDIVFSEEMKVYEIVKIDLIFKGKKKIYVYNKSDKEWYLEDEKEDHTYVENTVPAEAFNSVCREVPHL